MFQEHLNQAVDQISKLNDINTSDLKLLTERYPYCQTAQVLYTKKLHEENSSTFEKQLQKTSSLVYDRKVLFHFVEKTPLQSTVTAGFDHEEDQLPLKSETLELPTEIIIETPIPEILHETSEADTLSDEPVLIHEDISDEILEDMIREQEVIEEDEAIEEEEIINAVVQDEPEVVHFDEEIKDFVSDQQDVHSEINYEMEELRVSDEEITEETKLESELAAGVEDLPESEMEPELDEPIFEMPGYIIERELGTLDEKDEIRINIKPPVESQEQEQNAPEPLNFEIQVSTFTGWLHLIAGDSKAKIVGLKDENRPVKLYERKLQTETVDQQKSVTVNLEESGITEDIAGELARKSIEPDERLVTETYARILYLQGKFAKAIEVYEQLSLKKPSKSDYFAALIEQIKKRK